MELGDLSIIYGIVRINEANYNFNDLIDQIDKIN